MLSLTAEKSCVGGLTLDEQLIFPSFCRKEMYQIIELVTPYSGANICLCLKVSL